MRFTSFLQDSQLTVGLTGEIDHHCAKSYISAISSKIEVYTPNICILDFQEDARLMIFSAVMVVLLNISGITIIG